VPPLITPAADTAQAQLAADSASVEPGGIARAQGNVRLEKSGQAVEAPSLTYNRRSTRLAAEQGLRYHTEGLNLTAERAEVNLDQELGVFEQAGFTLTENGGRGHAARIESLAPNLYQLEQTSYSTCPGPDEDKAWRLTAERIELNRESGRGQAWDAVLRLFDWPVLYTPYLNFPIDDRRQSGFLAPTIGQSDDSGFELATPYYVNLAPNYDATLTPQFLSDRGFQLGSQLRYLFSHHRGRVEGEFLPGDDLRDGDDRYLASLQHQGRLGRFFSITTNFTDVSDRDYFEDLDNTIASTSQSQLEQSFSLTFQATGIRVSALVNDFQDLDDDRPTFRTDTFARLPQVEAELLTPTRPWALGLNTQVTNFRRDDSNEGLRTHMRPHLVWRMDRLGWYANAEAAVRYTRYDLTETDDATSSLIERTLPTYTAEAGLRFERHLDNGWLQTLEPRLFYLYNEFEEQDDIPIFDTGTPDLNFDRLFADNRFTGLDRIGDANQLTLGATSRLLDAANGRSVLRLDIGGIIGFRDRRVTLRDTNSSGHNERGSDVVAGVQYRPGAHWSAELQGQYDPGDNRMNRAAAALGYEDDAGRRVTLGYRLNRDIRPELDDNGLEDLEQIDTTLVLPVGERWEAIGRWNYSLDKNRSVETLAGLEYRASCCWAVRGAWRRSIQDQDGSSDSSFLLQVELTGLGRLGDNIRDLLDRDIVGRFSANNRIDTP